MFSYLQCMRVDDLDGGVRGAPQLAAGQQHAAHGAAARAHRDRRPLRPGTIW